MAAVREEVTRAICLLMAACGAGAAERLNVTACGARGDGKHDDRAAVQRCIDRAAGGGVVAFPPGAYVAGEVVLKSGVTLELAAGATLAGNVQLTGVEAVWIIGASPRDSSIRGVMSIRRSRRVRFRGFTQEGHNGQGYADSADIEVRDVTIRQTRQRQPEGSAIWFVNCRDIFVTDCGFRSNDDVFCLKRSAENVRLTRAVLQGDQAAPFAIGTETDGVFRNIRVTDCTIRDSDRGAITIESVDGSVIDGVTLSRIRMSNVGAPLFIRLGDRLRYGGNPGAIRNIAIEDVEAAGGSKDIGIGSSILGLPGRPIEKITLRNIRQSFCRRWSAQV
jgi:polygalacturonase